MATALLEPRTVAANAPPRRTAAIIRMVKAFERKEIEAAIDGLIAVLDARDGDSDIEDSEAGETAINRCGRMLHVRTLADHFPGDDDGESECAWQEWDQRDQVKLRRQLHEPVGANTAWGSEDDEEGDEDTCQAGDDGCAPFMSHYGPRWGSHVDDSDREPEWCGTFAFEVEAGTLAVSST